MALADTKECTNSSTFLIRLHFFTVVCHGPVHTWGQGKQIWNHGGLRFPCTSKSLLQWRPLGTPFISHVMPRTHILPLGTLGLKGRTHVLYIYIYTYKIQKPVVTLCYLPKAERSTTAGWMLYLDLNFDREMKETETRNVADTFL